MILKEFVILVLNAPTVGEGGNPVFSMHSVPKAFGPVKPEDDKP